MNAFFGGKSVTMKQAEVNATRRRLPQPRSEGSVLTNASMFLCRGCNIYRPNSERKGVTKFEVKCWDKRRKKQKAGGGDNGQSTS